MALASCIAFARDSAHQVRETLTRERGLSRGNGGAHPEYVRPRARCKRAADQTRPRIERFSGILVGRGNVAQSAG